MRVRWKMVLLLALPTDEGKVENGIITCPAHGFQYRLETGECLTVPDVSLQSYPLQIRESKVFVQLR